MMRRVPYVNFRAQFDEERPEILATMENVFARGEFIPLRDWLRREIHQHGACFTAAQLIDRITGKPLSPEPMMSHLHRKLDPIYGL